jgi:RES domain-containing protein
MSAMKPYAGTPLLTERFRASSARAFAREATAFRALQTEYANRRDLLSGEGTRRYGGRWTPPGSFATVHASLDAPTALAESLGTRQRYGLPVAERLPLTLVAFDFRLQALLTSRTRKSLPASG